MKVVLICATLFVFFSMLMNSARKRGKLGDNANRAVTGLATSMRRDPLLRHGLAHARPASLIRVATPTLTPVPAAASAPTNYTGSGIFSSSLSSVTGYSRTRTPVAL
jgi:hypothetical protein